MDSSGRNETGSFADTVRIAEMPSAAPATSLAELRRRLDDLTRLVSDWVWELDSAYCFTFVSHRSFDVLECAPQLLTGRKLTEVLAVSKEPALVSLLERRLPFRDVDCAYRTAGGQQRFFLLSGLPVFCDRTGAFLGYRGTASDVTRQRHAEQALLRRDAVMRAVGRAAELLLAAADWQQTLPGIVASLGEAAAADRALVLPVPENCERRPGGDPDLRSSVGASADDHTGGDDWETAVRSIALAGRVSWLAAGEAVTLGVVANGPATLPTAAVSAGATTLVVPILAGGKPWGSLAFRRDGKGSAWDDAEIEALKTAASIIGSAIHRQRYERDLSQSQERLRHQANYDLLTDLPNRHLFFDRLKGALARARRDGHSLALVSVDLDRFNSFNDTLGPEAGDEILRQVAQRLNQWAEGPDTVARLASDEFVLVISGIGDRARVAAIVPRILAALAEPFRVGDAEVFVRASIGSALYPDDAEDPLLLLKNADVAMLRAKQLGGNTYQFYAAGTNARAQRFIALDQHLHHALQRSQLELFYQPVVEIRTGRIVGAEALLRWHHPEFGPVPPEDFILVAEESGLIEPIGHWVLHEACRQARTWRRLGFPKFRIAVNVSSRQLSRGRLLSSVFSALAEADLSPSALCVEITETAILEDDEDILATLEKLRAMGIALAIDDFGTGYASLTCLRRLPLTSLKIDQSFVRGMTADAGNSAIVDAILTMANGLGLGVIAEGVGNEGEAEQLRAMGCELMQGFLFSRPLPADRFTALLCNDGTADQLSDPATAVAVEV